MFQLRRIDVYLGLGKTVAFQINIGMEPEKGRMTYLIKTRPSLKALRKLRDEVSLTCYDGFESFVR
jgi:hypothetical protein